jgi:hypothetical protein
VVDVGLLMTSVTVANAGTAAVTKAVVARAVVLLPAVCVTPVVPVGREGVPEKLGLAKGAAPETSATASVTAPVRPATEVTGAEGALARTKAVVAICVVFVPSVAVGAVGTPVRAGEAKGA